LAEALGADVVVAHLPTRWPIRVLVGGGRSRVFPLIWRRNHRERDWFLNELPRLQADTPVKIAVEIMPRFRLARWEINAHYWNNLDEWTRFPHLTLDTTHCGSWGIDPRQVFDRADGRVSHVHLSNYDGREHIPPHRGELPLDAFLQHLATAGYEGHISVETTPATMNFEDESLVRQNLADSLAFCRQHFRPGAA
jgi:sugar phosphate isomerase/epimerase